jgi:hypothetical protein
MEPDGTEEASVMRGRRSESLSAEVASGPSAGLQRRALLRGLAAGGGAIAAVAASSRASAEQERQAETTPDDPTKLDYRETEHVRWFYRRARM